MNKPASPSAIPGPDPEWIDHGYGTRFQGFQNLMRHRIRDVLLVSSQYDLYVFEEDGRLYELIRNEYQGLNLSHSPEITRVSNGKTALAHLQDRNHFDLVITTQHIEDMTATQLAKSIRNNGFDIPVVLLSYDNRELTELLKNTDTGNFDRIFIWTGNFRILIAIIKHLEDMLNVEQDTRLVGVQAILLIEDSVRFYSAYLPLLYTEILKQSQELISEGINLTHKFLRMRARPKIILATNYEEAWDFYTKYENYILGIVSDVDFMRNGKQDPEAGIIFAKQVKKQHPDIPILLQSTNGENAVKAEKINSSFVLKQSPTLLNQFRQFTNEHFGFGDFKFRLPGGTEVGRAADLISLEKEIEAAPIESILYHAERNHFSNWLKARTEFWLAHKLRPRKITDFKDPEALRENLIESLQEYQTIRQRGIITDFNKNAFDPKGGFARIGGGSIGGKARGLSFVNNLIYNYKVHNRYKNVKIYVPTGFVLGTDIFDAFMDGNKLTDFAINTDDDDKILQRFEAASYFPEEALADMAGFLDLVKVPLAVRSSSLLEDSQYHPFAGVYQTYMLPNNQTNPLERLNDLVSAIKRVYASTYFSHTKDYIRITSYHLEEEKMAVIVQKMVGQHHGERFYPDFSGVAKSYNYYPVKPQTPEDGIAYVALGLGKTVVDGGNTVRFVPKYPTQLMQFSSISEIMKTGQREFYALSTKARDNVSDTRTPKDACIHLHGLDVAEKDGTLYSMGSTYSHENNAVYDGLSRKGARIVTFAPILKQKLFPLPDILELLLEMGSWGMGTAIEIEFAVNLSVPPGQPKEFGLLQIRPMVVQRELEALELDSFANDKLICKSENVLGNGKIDAIRDIVYVDYENYDRSKSIAVAGEITKLNSRLVKENCPYLLIGVGRWGTLDPWLGIPVKWEQISGARCIIESSFKDFDVKPSQGSHFFQNLTSFMVGYFTVRRESENNFINWGWLNSIEPHEAMTYCKHIRLENPITITMNGRTNHGVVLMPEDADQ
jgi:CheY-like chemotaxis protein